MSERTNICDKLYDEENVKNTPIQKFYENQTIFITGGTGFIGKVLIEKLLRCCSGISRIYILIRKKKNKNLQERIKNLLEDAVFDKVRSCVQNFEEKIVGIAGDCSLENLGLSDCDINLLKKEVSIIFHSAATVRFDEKLKLAIATNIQSTITITEMCKDMKNLKAFVYVSTGYAHCFNNFTIEEKFYDYPIDHKDLVLLVNSLSEETMEGITPVLLKPWLNTYTCTKALAENYLKTDSQSLPIGIFRPLIVTPSVNEPMPGWTDNYNGATGVIAGINSGVLRTVHCIAKMRANLVPVDFTINALIACAWDVSMHAIKKDNNTIIYNFTATSESPVTWSRVRENCLKYNKKYPLNTAIWHPSLRMTKYKFLHQFYDIFYHWVPAFIIDLAARSVGQKPRMTKVYEKIHKFLGSSDYVLRNEWDIKNDHVKRLWKELDPRDQKMFRFTMQNFDWDEYFSTYIKGIRLYLFKDDLKTLNASRTRYKILFLIEKILQAALLASTYCTIRKILQRRSYKPPY